ncbi:MAG: hypothetical protein ACC656_07110 [Candidatus Heimdallarchaeota archaeon]
MKNIFDNLPEEQLPWAIKKLYNSKFIFPISRVGLILITYKELVDKLGLPIPFDGDKTHVEWYIEFQDGKFCSIYDYKAEVLVEEVNLWSIGGQFARARIDLLKDDPVVEHVQNNFPKNQVFTNSSWMETRFSI